MMSRHDKIDILRDWIERSYGSSLVNDIPERVARLLEEATELAQSEGMSLETANQIVSEVFARKLIGNPYQEAGGVSITFLAYCGAKAWSPYAIEMDELRRILAKPPEFFRKRQLEKYKLGVAKRPTGVEHMIVERPQ